MRLRQMGFSTKIKAHKNILTLETLRFIAEFLIDHNAHQAALRSGIHETYASRYGSWLKKRPQVIKALEQEYDESDLKKINQAMSKIQAQMEICKEILGLNELD
jgi:phage terminase small subunit